MRSVTIEDVCKKDFEVFCDLWNYDKTIDENGFYSSSLTDRFFTSFCAGWQASRKAMVVELPGHDNFAVWISRDMVDGHKSAIGDVRDALDAAGVAYK